MNWKALLKTILHAAGGAGACAAASAVLPIISAHVDPSTGAIIGSVASSVISSFCKPPQQS